jgi:diacylglycerol kinase family enzyme
MTMQSLQRMRVVVLLNASAGAVQRLDGATLREALEAAFEINGISGTLEFSSGTELEFAAERARQQVIARELDAIVVGGGDGSVRTVASLLVGSGVPLGIIPLGTFNHFARDLSIPFAIDEAVAVIAAGDVRPIDVAEVNSRIFINNSSIGVYPFLVLERERRRRRKKLSKWMAMILAAPRVLRNLPLFRVTVRVEGLVEPFRSPCVFVGNNEYRLALPGVGRRERLDGGELAVYVAKAQGRLSLLWLACRCIFGRVDQERDLRIFKVEAAEISTRRRRVLVAFDGEIEALHSPLRYRTRPGALRVFVPRATGSE